MPNSAKVKTKAVQHLAKDRLNLSNLVPGILQFANLVILCDNHGVLLLLLHRLPQTSNEKVIVVLQFYLFD